MKKPDSVYIVLLLVLVLVGCTGPPPKPVKPVRPEWTAKVPGEAGGKMTFVGVSTFFSTEQSARDNALEVATAQVVKYISTDARGNKESLAKTFGLKADTINETIGGREFQKQVYGAVSRQLKAKKWYYETKSDGYIYFVLTQVPISVLDDSLKNAHADAEKDARKRSKDANTAAAKEQALNEAEFHSQMSKDGFMD